MGIAEVLPKYFAPEAPDPRGGSGGAGQRRRRAGHHRQPGFLPAGGGDRQGARGPSLRTIHYVAPSVWAWRPGRAAKMARVIDHVLALLPFEPPYMTAAGMTCDFVGHPVVAEPLATSAEAAALQVHGRRAAPAGAARLAPGRGDAAGAGLRRRSSAQLQARHPDCACAAADRARRGRAGAGADGRIGRSRPQIIEDAGAEARGLRRGGCGAGGLGHRVAGTGGQRLPDGHRL